MTDNHNMHKHKPSCHDTGSGKKKIDLLFWVSISVVAALYTLYGQFSQNIESYQTLTIFAQSVYELINIIWWGIALGILMVGVLAKVPREFIISILGSDGGLKGILKATLGGFLLDLCSHGILMVAAKLYERGASTGQVIAFLVASPWNSFSLTIILFALIGLPWTLAFIAF